MAQTIQVKRSTATTAPAELANGELAYSHVGTDGKLFIGRPGGSAGDVDAIGGKYYIDRSETAYGWGDHALAGYAASSSLDNYLPLSGGTMTGNLTMSGSSELRLSTTASLYSISGSTFLSEYGAGNLELMAHDIYFRSDSGGSDTDYFAKFIYNGGVELYHDGTKTTETTSTGLRVETVANPTITIKSTDTTVVANEVIGTLEFIGTDDQTGGVLAGQIQQVAAQGADWGTGNYGSNMSFSIKEAGSGAPFVEKLRLQTSGVVLTGNLAVSGTVEGRDVATDGTKLDTIATNANNYTLTNLNNHLAGGVGNIVTSGYIRGPASMVIDPAAHGDETGALTILGDLIVEGTTTTINSTVVDIADERIELNTAQLATELPPTTLVAGVTVNRGSGNAAHILWREANNGWYLSEDGAADFEILHANNWSTAYTGVVDGGSF